MNLNFISRYLAANEVLTVMRTWKSTLQGLLVILILMTAFLPGMAWADADEEFVPGQVLIKLSSPRYLRTIAKKYRLSPAPIERFGTRPIYLMRILDGADPVVRAAELEADPLRRVEFAEPNFQVEAPEARGISWSIGGSSSEYVNQWFRGPLRLAIAHQQTLGDNIKIAVLDTGIDASHPAFAGRLLTGYDFVDDDSNPQEVGAAGVNPGFGHGTHVSGLVLLVAPNANIVPIRVLDPNGVGNVWVLAEALAYAADPDRDPTTADGVDIINLSLATRRETDLLRLIIGEISCGGDDDLRNIGIIPCPDPMQRGIFVAAGSGNRGSDILEYPAAEDLNGVVSVGASNQTDVLTAFSNYGQWVDIASPGQSILSTVPGPGGRFGTWSGTSMSTPLVAGAAALIRSQNPDWTSMQLRERIISSGVTIIGPNAPNKRLDVAACVGQ